MQIATATATLDWLDECRAQEGISRRVLARENANKRAKSENVLRWNEYQQVMAKANRDANDGFSGKKICGRLFRWYEKTHQVFCEGFGSEGSASSSSNSHSVSYSSSEFRSAFGWGAR